MELEASEEFQFRGIGEDHRHQVETDAFHGDVAAAGVLAGGAEKMLLLFGIVGSFGWAEIGGRARLYFDHNERVAFPCDQVGFGIAGGPGGSSAPRLV